AAGGFVRVMRRASGAPTCSVCLRGPFEVAGHIQRRRSQMKRLLIICTVLSAAPALAGQEWELITITRGDGWEVNQATGALKENGKVLEGGLKDKKDGQADYGIRVEIDGGKATATFRFISEGDEGAKLSGSYEKGPNPTKTHCPEQIQLVNSHQYIGLARD